MISSQGLVRTISITGALWLSGKIAAQAFVTVPGLLKSQSEDGISSSVILQVWRRVYETGHSHSPQIAAITSTGFAYLAWYSRGQRSSRPAALLYSIAALSVVGIVPYTLVFMRSTNDQLLTRASGEHSEATDVLGSEKKRPGAASGQQSTEDLLQNWGILAGIRGLLPLTGGVMGLLATQLE